MFVDINGVKYVTFLPTFHFYVCILKVLTKYILLTLFGIAVHHDKIAIGMLHAYNGNF